MCDLCHDHWNKELDAFPCGHYGVARLKHGGEVSVFKDRGGNFYDVANGNTITRSIAAWKVAA